MTPFLKTYIIDAPWRTILFSGLFFAVTAGGLFLLAGSRNNGAFFSGHWYVDLSMWFSVGLLFQYSTWLGEGYLERKNARWKAKKEQDKAK